MPPTLRLSDADIAFFEAIAGRFDRLLDVLHERFTYRTTADTILGKAGLIRYLSHQRIRLYSPKVIELGRVTTDRTSVHQGIVSMTVQDESGIMSITSSFLHVWVAGDAVTRTDDWQLVYREVKPSAA